MSHSTAEPAAPPAAADSRRTSAPFHRLTRGRPVRVVATWLLLLVIAAAALYAGMRLRVWAFHVTTPIRYLPDIERGHDWGQRAYDQGYLDLYELKADQTARDRDWLDYAPLRLLLMREWAAWRVAHYGHDSSYRPGDWLYNMPVLAFNALMEALAAFAAFLVVVVWVRRDGRPAPPPLWTSALTRLRPRRAPSPAAPALAAPPLFRGYFRGTIAALCVWFNPAIILSAHGWPTWDMWVIPFFLIGVFLASTDWWFCAGLAVGIGAMFKGQQLFCASIFLLWPVFRGRFGAAGRFLAGLVFAIAVIASPWLASFHPDADLALPRRIDVPAILWIAGITGAVFTAAFLIRRAWRRPPAPAPASTPLADGDAASARILAYRRAVRPGGGPWLVHLALALLGIVLLAGAALWPAFTNPRFVLPEAALGAAVLIALAALLPFRAAKYTAAAAFGAGLLATTRYFHGSVGWYNCTFVYGTIHWETMVMGLTSNLPGILEINYGWHNVHEILFTLPAHWLYLWPAHPLPVDVRSFLFAIFAVLLVLSCLGIARHDRANSARFLVAVTTPWILFFTIPAQIHERYLLYAAGIGMIAVGYSYGMLLLGLFLTVTTWTMTIHVMLSHADHRALHALWGAGLADTMWKYVHHSHPGIGWAVCLACLIYLYLTLTPDPRKRFGAR